MFLKVSFNNIALPSVKSAPIPRIGDKKTSEQAPIPRIGDIKTSEQVEHFILSPSNAMTRSLPNNKVFMTGPWVPTFLMEPDPMQDPYVEVHVFNNTAMAMSVKLIDAELQEKVGLNGAWEAWESLRPWAFRADLWRYMILWSEGGVYLDSKIRIRAPLITWAGLLASEELSACRDGDLRYKSKRFPNEQPVQALWNGGMSARKGSQVLLEAIRASVSNVLNRSYVLPYFDLSDLGQHADLSVTGPILLGYASRFGVHNGTVRVPCTYRAGKMGMASNGNYKVFEKDEKEHERVRNAGNKYGELYQQKRIYCIYNSSSTLDAPCDLQALLNATKFYGVFNSSH